MSSRSPKILFADLAPAEGRKPGTERKLSPSLSGRCTIGVMDISARAGLLFRVLERINRRQSRYHFAPVEGPLPTGIGVMSGRLKQMAIDDYGVSAEDIEKFHLDENVYTPDYCPWLEGIRRSVNVDRIVGLVHPMLAFVDEEGFKWNYFSLSEDQIVYVSTCGLREYAKIAGRPFEACVAISIVAQVWESVYNVGFHHETSGCIFDHCENRDDIVEKFRSVTLSPESLSEFPSEDQADVLKTIEAIRTYSR